MIYWIGDLNYRVQTSHEMTFEVIKAHADNFQIQTLLKHDQLLNEMKRDNVFWNFIEMPIDFKPTYKYDPGTNDWDSRYYAKLHTNGSTLLKFPGVALNSVEVQLGYKPRNGH